MFHLFDLFRRSKRTASRRAGGRRPGLEALEGRAVPASLAGDTVHVTLSDVLVSSYDVQGSASRVSTNDFHFVTHVDKASPTLFMTAPEGAAVTYGSQSTGAGAGKVTF